MSPVSARVDWDEAKLSIPATRPGTVPREDLVGRLVGPPHPSLVCVIAPAGYGKTTLLAQWTGLDRRRFAWVHVDDRDNDATVLLTHVIAALDRIEPLDESVSRALTSPATSIWSTVVPRLGRALSSRRKPFVLVLDDVHALHSHESLDVVTALVRHLPRRSQIALGGRMEPGLPVERLRLADGLLELGAVELALTTDEAQALLRESGVELPKEEVDDLTRTTEGWAAGLYLAALALRDETKRSVPRAPFTGDDRFVTDYLRIEHLARIPRKQVEFLTRTAVLDRMCGDLCDSVLERSDSARMLESIERSNLFLVPLDHSRTWYRYHQLFRDVLRTELQRREPDLAADLFRRAADWCERHELPEEALRYAAAGDDTDRAARLITTLALPLYRAGRMATAEEWLERLGLPVDRYPAAAVLRAWLHVFRGRAAEAEQWLDAVERSGHDGPLPDGSASIQPWTALLRAFMCPAGIERMQADAELAGTELGPLSPWRPTALLMLGVALLLEGDHEASDAILARTIDSARTGGATYVRVMALSERALMALERDDTTAAAAFVEEARLAVDEERFADYVPTAILLAADARVALRVGDRERARDGLVRAQRLRPLLTSALPWHAVQTLVELSRVQLALGDPSGAGTLLAEARAVMRVRPCLGVLVEQVAELRRAVASHDEPRSGWSSSLTAAELRLLPLLSTHLTFREIGERLYVSRNTVKTQAISIYRKLDVSSRGDAVMRAGELGLVEVPVNVGDFTLSG